jgi:hypothetical protein
MWSTLVPPCLGACAGNHSNTASEAFLACADACWRWGEASHQLVSGWGARAKSNGI